MSAKQITAGQKLVVAWMKTHPPKVTAKAPKTKSKEKTKRLSPQERVAAAVREGLGKPKTVPITLADWQKVDSLDLASRQLRDISALTQCTALREVDLGRNGLSNLTQLEVLGLEGCAVTSLAPPARHTRLRRLVIPSKNVRFLSIKHCPIPPAQGAAELQNIRPTNFIFLTS